MEPLIGIDISIYQWPQGVPHGMLGRLNRLGVRFLIARTTIGTTRDRSFEPNRARATGRGWVPGGYHFLYPGVEGERQAEAYIDYVKDSGGGQGLLHVLDVERNRGERPTMRELKAWVKRYREAWPRHPLGLYTSRSIWASYGNPDITDLGFDYIWQALWPRGVDTPADLPERPPAGFGGERRPPLWQWGSLEVKSPTSDKVHHLDGNAWYGSLPELRQLAYGERPPVVERPAYQLAYNDTIAAASAALAGLALPGGTPVQRAGQEAALEAATDAVSELVLSAGGNG